MMNGKTEHRELPHPVAHPDQHGSIPMTDDRKRNTGGEVERSHPLLAVAQRNIRQFLSKASFAHEADRWSAGQCLDVMDSALAESRSVRDDLAMKAHGYMQELEHQKARADRLAGALQIAYRHIDIAGLRVSHCKDAAAIDAALNLEPTP